MIRNSVYGFVSSVFGSKNNFQFVHASSSACLGTTSAQNFISLWRWRHFTQKNRPWIQGLELKYATHSLRTETWDVGMAPGIWNWMNILHCRCSTFSDTSKAAYSGLDLFTFLESTLDAVEGPSHRWMNIEGTRKEACERGGIFLVAINVFCQNDLISRHECSILIDKLKFIQQRFPDLHVFGIQHGFQFGSPHNLNQIKHTILKEYITFPVLLSSKDLSKVVNGAFYLFEDFKNPISINWNNIEIETMFADIRAFQKRRVFDNEASQSIANSSVGLGLPERSVEFVKEPAVCNLSKELLLSFPGSVSADEDGQHIFVSDTNHHRIIVADANGRILDCIGSSPGFEDGPFETAKMCRPASSVFWADQGCLYFADSENHAIRKADMEQRTVQTVYPTSDMNQGNALQRFINRLMHRLHFKRMNDKDSEEVQVNSPRFPWHLAMTEDNNLLIVNHGFGDLWILDTETGEIKEIFEGMHSVVEIFRHKSINKTPIADGLFDLLISKQRLLLRFVQDFSALDLVSSLAKLQNIILLVDTDGQRILKLKLESGEISSVQLSNLGCLGLPYWWPCAAEKIFDSRNSVHKYVNESHRQTSIERFHVQPGRCEIVVNLILPRRTKLGAPLDKGCIWRQSRGSVVELSMYDGMLMADKIGPEQQFYDELESVLSDPDSFEEATDLEHNHQESEGFGTFIHSSVDVSHGVGEIIIDGVVYLTLDESSSATGDSTANTRSIVDVLDKDKSTEKEMCILLLSEACKEQEDIVFMKHAHIRIRLKCSDDAPAERKLFVNLEL